MNLCPICNQPQEFSEYRGRAAARCRYCGSLERHRFVYLFLKKFIALERCSCLHIAPEKSLRKLLKENCFSYNSAGLAGDVMHRFDISKRIKFADDTFHLIVCNHVLEHVEQDVAAMKEFRRVLHRDGSAVITVPITAGDKTFEVEGVTTDEQRLRLYGQRDHVRRYGQDFTQRLASAGFKVHTFTAEQLCSERRCQQYGIASANDQIFLAQ